MRETTEGVFEEHCGRERPEPGAAAKPVPNVRREVLADAEHHRPLSPTRKANEGEGERVWAEDPDRVEAAEPQPERFQGTPPRAKHRTDVGQAPVPGKWDERDGVGRDHVRAVARPWLEPAEEHELVDLLSETDEEVHERDVARQHTGIEPVPVSRVDAEPEGHRAILSEVAPRVCIVVPALNEAADIEACVLSVLDQESEGGLEVFVVDGGSTDTTAQLAREAGATVLANPDRSIPAALNRGLAAARGDVLLRFDAHAEMKPGYVSACLRALAEEDGAANVGGWCTVRPRGPWGRALAGALGSSLGVGNARLWRQPRQGQTRVDVDSVPFGCFAVAALQRAGGWREDLAVNEDYELNHRLRRAGGRVVFDPAIQAVYVPRESPLAIAQQYWRYGRWKAVMLRGSPRSLRPRQLAPPMLLITACVSLSGPLAPTARAVLGAYAVLLAGATLRARSGWRTAPLLMAMHTSWAAGLFTGLLLPPRNPESAKTDAGVRDKPVHRGPLAG